MPRDSGETQGTTPATEASPVVKSRFSQVAETITGWTGSAWAFYGAVGTILLWLVLGPVCEYSDTWQLTINTGTSIITFLMVFLIQRTQNRDTRAIHLKLNELLAAVEGASNRLINAEDLDDESMSRISHQFQTLAETIREEGRTTRASSVEEVTPLEVPVADLASRT